MMRILAILLACLALLQGVVAGPPDAAGRGGGPAAGDGPDDPQAAEERILAARGYVLVSSATQTGWLTLPEEGACSYPLRQILPDGTETLNVIHLTPEGVCMEDATCENHDCVQQGAVTLENRDGRILGNMIICLPNQVVLQLFTPEEVLEMVRGGAPAP